MMDNREDRLHKPDNLEGRLKLKKNWKESIDDNKVYPSDGSNNKCEKNESTCEPQSSCVDDSIMDFKSPKKCMSLKNTNGKKLLDKPKNKISRAKIKIINNKKKPGSNKLLQNKSLLSKNICDAQQSIESSFFKTENKIDSPQSPVNVKTACVCPLCFKNFKDESTQAVHMKSCAIKNNVSTKKLLSAVELQERQAAERKSLGLLSAPVLQDKKKPVSRKAILQDDPDLQLALALSKSLYEKEEMEILDEAEIVAISSSPSLPDGNKECFQRTTLQSFGFISNRSISPINNCPTNKMKRRKLIQPTVLQRRTNEERERILTERITEILMNYKDFTQKTLEENEQSIDVKEKIVIKSQLLQQLRKTENTLWDRTRLTPSQNTFYVTQLFPQITPLPEKKHKLNEDQNVIELTDQIKKESLTKELQEIKEIQAVDTTDSNEELTISSKTYCREKFLDTLATDWRNILNDSSASDIIVLVKNSRYIWVHKLVFYVRCTNILLDVISNDTEFSTVKEKIRWIDVDYDIALAFLEFVYCGTIDRHSKILDSDKSLFAIRSLARKYKVNDLFVYLRQKKFEFNLAAPEHEKSAENVITNAEEILNVSELSKLTCKASSNHTYNDLKDTQCAQKTLLQEDIIGNCQSPAKNYVLVEDSCILEHKEEISVKSLEQINSRNNTPIHRGISVSPDIFADTLDVIKPNDKSANYSKDYEDSNIHMLLSLIKQDTDISVCSQKLTKKTDDAKYSKSDKNIFACLKNEEQNVMEIDLDSNLDSFKPSVDSHKDSLMDTPQNSKPQTTQEHSSNAARQKSNLTLFIEKIQRENAKSDSDLDSDLDITTYSNKVPRIRHSNPFCIDKWNNSDNENFDNFRQSSKTRKKLGKLSIIEQRMRSFANKNPEFYSTSSNEDVTDVKQTNTSSTSFEKIIESSHNDIKLCHYLQNVVPSEKDVNTLDLITNSSLSTVHLPYSKTMNRSLNESIYDLEVDEKERDEKEISMYSKYMRNHHNNSIAKYRAAITKDTSDSNLSDESASDVSNKVSDTNENDAVMAQSFLTQKDINVIVLSDTEVESVSSSANCPVDLHNDDSNNKNYARLFKKTIEYNKQDIEDKESNHSLGTEELPKLTTNLEEQKNINSTTKSDRTKFNTNGRNMTPDIEDVELNMIFTQVRSGLNESNKDEVDSHKEEFIPSPIIVFSSPDLNIENSFLDKEDCNEYVPEIDSCKSKKSTGFSFNFEDDIYLANVDVDKYEKHHVLQKSKSASVLNITEFKKDNSRRCSNKNNCKNIIDDYKTTDDIIHCESLDRNITTLTQNFTSIRKFKRKSLSEEQININRPHGQKDTSKHTSMQFQYNYSQNIRNIKTVPKIICKTVTPPPDYDGMRTPELHGEMKRYGLKVQKRCKAVKLLKHIYNELHPLIPIDEINTEQKVAEISSDEEGPPVKKPNTNDNSIEESNNIEENNDELSCSQDSDESVNSIKSTISKEMEFYETKSLPTLENLSDIREAFTKLINVDKDLYNKILRYEPVNIEQLHATLRSHGFRCKLSNFMNFLDEQCITFYVPEQSMKNKTRRKT